jgi:uncharacterized membrane protein YheB (UPF0754 family)
MNWWLLFIPVISAFIGWIINRFLVKLLFRPHKPVKVLGFTLHGIFPKRQKQYAVQIGKLVSSDLFSFPDIEDKIVSPENVSRIMPVVETHIDDFLRNRLKDAFPMIGMFIGERTINELKAVFMKELEQIFPVVMKDYMTNLKQQIDLEQIVIAKLSAFSPERLETIVYQNMWKEVRFFEIAGALTGFIIGLIQVLLTIII